MKKIINLGALLLLPFLTPDTVEAYEAPITDGEVAINTIVNHFNGESTVERDKDGNYYNEFIFDGHIIQAYSGQSVVRVDGKVVPYVVEEAEGVLLPKPFRLKNTYSNPTLPAEFFNRHFGYEIEGEQLIYDERRQTETPEGNDEEVVQDNVTDNANDGTENNHTEEPSDQPVNDTEEDKETDKKEEAEEEKKEELTPPEEEDEKVEEAEELGVLNLSIDVRNYGLNQTSETGINGQIEENTFNAYFENEETIVVTWTNQNQKQTVDVTPNKIQNLTFKTDNGDYYTIQLNIEDTRPDGLSTETIIRYVKNVNKGIIIHSGNQKVQLTYSDEDQKKVTEIFTELEETLAFLGIQQFELEENEDEFIIRFYLYDSSWSA